MTAAERGVFAFAQGDADQQRGHALGDRPHVVLRGGREVDDTEIFAGEAPVCARQVVFRHELAAARDHDGVDIGAGPLLQESLQAAELRAVEADLLGRRNGPAVVDRLRLAAGLGGRGHSEEQGKRQERASDHRRPVCCNRWASATSRWCGSLAMRL
ncbi:MAG TPA: hypothetical protein VFF19_20030 [Reyranella sp.]|nr:hypothetical protein [Reyranella sp.]